MYFKNRKLLTEYFKSSAKQKAECLGLELEHFALFNDKSSAEYMGQHGIKEILTELMPCFENMQYRDGSLIGMYNKEYAISLEPASQFEISITPQTDINEIGKIYEHFLKTIGPAFKANGLHLETFGYRPRGSVYDLPLIPKKRYEYMDRYFKTSGTCGINMMRGTASAQISIDFTSESDFISKYRFAYLIMPAIKLICDNTPIFENKPNSKHLIRTYIWRNTDPDRCSPPADLFEDSFGFESYANFLMNVPLILLPHDGKTDYVGNKTAVELFADKELTQDDIAHIMSMVFPDVRLKSYIEIRGADSMPIQECLGYAALIKGLFYSDNTVKTYLNKYKINRQDIILSENSLIKSGKSGKIYDVNANDFIEELFDNAAKNISKDELKHLHTLKDFYEAQNERNI